MEIGFRSNTVTGTMLTGDNNTEQFHSNSWTHPYPPIVRLGPVNIHGLPYLEYGTMGQFYDIAVVYSYLSFCFYNYFSFVIRM
jgi:hypothetical protein